MKPVANERPRAAAWQVVHASVTGSAHLEGDRGNEDALRISDPAAGELLLVLADGAGSAQRAREGAWLAVDAVTASLAATAASHRTSEQRLRDGLRAARDAIARASRAAGARPRQYACTLLILLLTEEWACGLQTGDGAIVVRAQDEWLHLTEPHHGRFAGETQFVTGRGARKMAGYAQLPIDEVDAVALLTDGLEQLAIDGASGEPHAPFFEPLARFAAADSEPEEKNSDLAAFLASERIRERTADDLSLIVAVPR